MNLMVLVNQICLIIKIYSCPKFLVDTHDFEDCFLRVLLSLSLGYDVEVVPVRMNDPVQ